MKRMWAACNRNLAVGIRNRNSQCSQASKGAGTVGAAGKVAQPRCALGKRSQHRIAVRNALITGQANRTNNIPRGLDNDVFHFPDDPESSSSAQLPECLIFISPAVALCRPTMRKETSLSRCSAALNAPSVVRGSPWVKGASRARQHSRYQGP